MCFETVLSRVQPIHRERQEMLYTKGKIQLLDLLAKTWKITLNTQSHKLYYTANVNVKCLKALHKSTRSNLHSEVQNPDS